MVVVVGSLVVVVVVNVVKVVLETVDVVAAAVVDVEDSEVPPHAAASKTNVTGRVRMDLVTYRNHAFL